MQAVGQGCLTSNMHQLLLSGWHAICNEHVVQWVFHIRPGVECPGSLPFNGALLLCRPPGMEADRPHDAEEPLGAELAPPQGMTC